MATLEELQEENALLRRYIAAMNASRLNAGVIFVKEEE